MAYYDLGNPQAENLVILTHGMSGWSYLSRRMISPLVAAGHRVLLFDQVGCGAQSLSCTPTASVCCPTRYARHVACVSPTLRALLGRSDKPDREEDYTYERHIGWNIDLLINHLHVKQATILLQDWGGLLGLRVVAAHPGRFSRLVIANTMLPTCGASPHLLSQDTASVDWPLAFVCFVCGRR